MEPLLLKFQYHTSAGSQYYSLLLNSFKLFHTQKILSLREDLTLALLDAG